MNSHDEEFHLTDEQLETIKEEVAKWQEFLNLTVGTLAFTMAIGILGLKTQRFWALVAFCFLVILVFPNMKRWPPTLNALKTKKLRSEREEIIYAGLMSRFFGIWALLKNFGAYWFGVGTLVAVVAGGGAYIERFFG